MKSEADYTGSLTSHTAFKPENFFKIKKSKVSGVLKSLRGLKVEVPELFDLESTLECGQAFRWRKVCGPDSRIWHKGVIGSTGVMVRFDTLSSSLLVLYDNEVTHSQYAIEPGDDSICAAEISSVSTGSPQHNAMSRTGSHRLAGDIFSYFSFDDDLETIYHFLINVDSVHGQAHLVMKEAIGHARGLRILRQDPWECLVSYIVSTNKNIPAISKVIEHFCSALGSPAGIGEYTFPSPERFLAAGLGGIQQSKCGYRAPYILDAAAKVLSNEVNLNELGNIPTREARQQLQTIKGVGPKVADCVLLFAYHRLDVFPVDVWITRSMSRFYLAGNKITPGKAREEGSRRFGSCAGYAQQILFNYARNVLDREFWYNHGEDST